MRNSVWSHAEVRFVIFHVEKRICMVLKVYYLNY